MTVSDGSSEKATASAIEEEGGGGDAASRAFADHRHRRAGAGREERGDTMAGSSLSVMGCSPNARHGAKATVLEARAPGGPR